MVEFVDFDSDLSDEDINFASIDFPDECFNATIPRRVESAKLPVPPTSAISKPLSEGIVNSTPRLKPVKPLPEDWVKIRIPPKTPPCRANTIDAPSATTKVDSEETRGVPIGTKIISIQTLNSHVDTVADSAPKSLPPKVEASVNIDRLKKQINHAGADNNAPSEKNSGWKRSVEVVKAAKGISGETSVATVTIINHKAPPPPDPPNLERVAPQDLAKAETSQKGKDTSKLMIRIITSTNNNKAPGKSREEDMESDAPPPTPEAPETVTKVEPVTNSKGVSLIVVNASGNKNHLTLPAPPTPDVKEVVKPEADIVKTEVVNASERESSKRKRSRSSSSFSRRRKFYRSRSYSSSSRSTKRDRSRSSHRSSGRSHSRSSRSRRRYSSSSRSRSRSRRSSSRSRSRSHSSRSRSRSYISTSRGKQTLDPMFLKKDLRPEDLDLAKYDSGGKKIFVGNLSFRTTEADLESLMEVYGKILKCYLALNRKFGFVVYSQVEDALRAVRNCNERAPLLQGRRIRVLLARARLTAFPVDRNEPKVERKFPSYGKSRSKSFISLSRERRRSRSRKRARSLSRCSEDFDMGGRKIFVGRLPTLMTQNELSDLFRPFGELEKCYIPRKHGRGEHDRSIGIGFVIYRKASDAAKAVREMNQSEIQNKFIQVKLALRSDLREGSRGKDSRYDKGGRKIHVGSLPFSMMDRELKEMFEEFGKIEECYVPLSHKTDNPMGYGFVTFERECDAEEAIRYWNGRVLGKRKITCEKAMRPGRRKSYARRRR